MKNKVRVLALIMSLAMILSSLVIVVPVSAADATTPAPLKEISTKSDGRPWTDFAGRVKSENGYYLFTDGTEDIPAKAEDAEDENAENKEPEKEEAPKKYLESGFAGGVGTKEDPYQIATAEQLALLAYFMSYENQSNVSRFQSKHYALVADIDLAGHEWVAIANSSLSSNPNLRFLGTFNGQGHTIKNMTVTPKYRADWTQETNFGITTAHQQIGLFGYLGGGAIVENFKLTGSINIENHTNASSKVGLVVGEVSGSSIVRNVDAYGTIKVVAKVAELPVGGIVGRSNNTIIQDCTMTGSIEVYGGTVDKAVIPCAGGITSQASGALTIDRTVNNADVTVYGNGSNSIVGGIVGKCGQISSETDPVKFGTYLTDCVNNGTICSAIMPDGVSPSNQRVGGIIGNLGRGNSNSNSNQNNYYMVNVSVIRCVNTGVVELGEGVAIGSGSGVSSIVGYMESQRLYKRNEKNELLKKDGNVTTDKNSAEIVPHYCKVTFEDCMTIASADMFVVPHYYASGTLGNFNGTTIPGGYGVEKSGDMFFAATAESRGGKAAVRFSKDAVNSLLAVGYTLDITYGSYKLTVKNAEELAEKVIDIGDSFLVLTGAALGAKPTVTLTRTLFVGTDIEKTYTVTAREATWSDFYTEEYYPLNAVDPDDKEAPAAGSAKNPYVIYRPAQLAKLSADIASFKKELANAHFILAADVDLGAHEWMPIGLSPASDLNGGYTPTVNLDGYGHTIKNVRLTRDHYITAQAFIGDATFNLSNVNFDGITVKTPATYPVNGGVAGLIGTMNGGKLENVHVKNLDIDYTVAQKDTEVAIGGLVGYLANGTITGSTVSGTVKVNDTVANNVSVGAIAGSANAGEINSSVNNAKITVTVDNKDTDCEVAVGGIVGSNAMNNTYGSAVIKGCYNKGTVTLNYSNKGNVAVAGIMGAGNGGSVTLNNCLNNAEIALNLKSGEAGDTVACASILGNYVGNMLTFGNNVSVKDMPLVGNPSVNVGSSNVVADFGIEIEERAGLRLDVESIADAGMMFRATYDEAAYRDMIAKGYEITFNMIIAPTAAFVKANGSVAALEGPRTIIDCSSVIANGKFAGAVTGLGAEYLNTNLSAAVSITIVKRDANGKVLVSETINSAFEEGEVENNIRALAEEVIYERRQDTKDDVYQYYTPEGDFSPYSPEMRAKLKAIYLPAV